MRNTGKRGSEITSDARHTQKPCVIYTYIYTAAAHTKNGYINESDENSSICISRDGMINIHIRTYQYT